MRIPIDFGPTPESPSLGKSDVPVYGDKHARVGLEEPDVSEKETWVVMVGGMHRSGTSWLARALSLCGLDLGERADWKAEDNPKGFWEDRLFVGLNDALLTTFGGSWDNPPHVADTAPGFHSDVIKALIADKTHPMGFKDPRVSLLFGVWKIVFADAVLVASIRHPMEVAQSLENRNGFPIEKSLELWEHYNRCLIEQGCRFVEFPSQHGLKKLVDDLGLTWNPEVEKWMDYEAIHHICSSSKTPEQHMEFYRQILESIEAEER